MNGIVSGRKWVFVYRYYSILISYFIDLNYLLKDKKHGCGQMITHPYLIINKLKAIRFS